MAAASGLAMTVFFALCLLPFALPPARADTVVMKDGTVYKGKIMIDTDKALLIGNPPFDNVSHLLEADDISKIVYEQYHPNPPAERKRGPSAELRLNGNFFSSNQLPLAPAPGLYAGLGFRVHPVLEIDGGFNWQPHLHSGDGLIVTDGSHRRGYEDFWLWGGEITGRLYPFHRKPWKIEPYVVAGYGWSRLTPNASGDLFTGSGWQAGLGAMRALSNHVFLEGRLVYDAQSLGSINFLGQKGALSPEITEHRYTFSAGVSYRI